MYYLDMGLVFLVLRVRTSHSQTINSLNSLLSNSQTIHFTHWSNVLLYRNRKVEIGVVICLRFFHGKNKNMVTKKISDEKVNSFLSHLKL